MKPYSPFYHPGPGRSNVCKSAYLCVFNFEEMIPVGSIIFMAVGAVLGIGLPVFLACWYIKRYNVRWKTVWVGAGVFVLFALVLESLVHQVVLKGPSGTSITGNIWYYALWRLSLKRQAGLSP